MSSGFYAAVILSSRDLHLINSLLNKSIRSPQALRIVVCGIHKFDIMADNLHYAEMSAFRSRYALKSREEFLHFLLLTCLGVLIGGIEFVLR